MAACVPKPPGPAVAPVISIGCLSRLNVEMQQRRIDVRIEPRFYQIRLRDAMPALALHINLGTAGCEANSNCF